MKKITCILLILASFFLNGCGQKDSSKTNNVTSQTKVAVLEEGDFVLKSGISLHYYYYKKPGKFLLVYFHGGPISDSTVIRGAVGKDLSDIVDGSILYIDEMGSGLSQKTGLELKNFNFQNEINGLHEIIQSFKLNRKIIIMGHSFGGTLTVHYAQAFPDEVYAYILSAPWLNEELCLDSRRKLSKQATKINEQEEKLSEHYKLPNDETKEKFSLAWYKNEALNTSNYLPLLQFLKMPTLVLSGEDDTNVTKKQIEAMKFYLKSASFVYIPNAGHKAYLSQKNKYLQTLQTFLQSLE